MCMLCHSLKLNVSIETSFSYNMLLAVMNGIFFFFFLKKVMLVQTIFWINKYIYIGRNFVNTIY